VFWDGDGDGWCDGVWVGLGREGGMVETVVRWGEGALGGGELRADV
jgi:hypothetical protein